MSLISIIVPIYKVEEYLEECIQSLVNQTYSNLEIILVDDGSPDACGEICDKWAASDARIRVIHKENGGLSDARNAGMEVARGKWIGFVDSDDAVHPRMYEDLIALVRETDSDIGCCSVTRDLTSSGVAGSGSSNAVLKSDGDNAETEDCSLWRKKGWKLFSSTEAIESLLRLEEISVTVWNKLYKRETIDSLKFPKGKYHEDEFWTYHVLSRAKRVAYIEMPYYGYRDRNDSITTQKYTSRHLDFLDARAERLEYMEKHYPQFHSLERTNIRFESIRAMQLCFIHMNGEVLNCCGKRIHKIVKKYPLKYKDYKSLPIGKQVWCMLSNITFDGTCKIRNKFHYGP